MPDLSTTYMGLSLASPLVPSASSLSRSLDNIKHMEDSGAAAVVLHSLFQEQIDGQRGVLDRYLTSGGEDREDSADALAYFAACRDLFQPPDEYLEQVRRASAAVNIPLIGSLNGVSAGDWIEYAVHVESAGAAALELNVYYIPTDPWLTSEEIEQLPVDLLREVKQRVHIPVAVKLSPYYTNTARLAHRLDTAGAAALVLFNRFYQPDIDPERRQLVPRPVLSTLQAPQALRLPLRWISLLYGRVGVDLAGSGGVHNAQDVLKLLLAGASVAMLASELLHHSIFRLTEIRSDLGSWMETHGYESLAQLRGSLSQGAVAYPAAFERAQYLRAIAEAPPDAAAPYEQHRASLPEPRRHPLTVDRWLAGLDRPVGRP